MVYSVCSPPISLVFAVSFERLFILNGDHSTLDTCELGGKNAIDKNRQPFQCFCFVIGYKNNDEDTFSDLWNRHFWKMSARYKKTYWRSLLQGQHNNIGKTHTKYTFHNEGLHSRHVGPGEPKGSALIRLYQITVAEWRFLFSRDLLHQDAVRLGLRLSNKRGRTSCVMGWDAFTLRQSHLAKENPVHKWFYCILLRKNWWFPIAG